MRHEPVKRKLIADGDVFKSTQITCRRNFAASRPTKFHILGAANPAVRFHRTMVCAWRFPDDIHILWFCSGRFAACLAGHSDTGGTDLCRPVHPETAVDTARRRSSGSLPGLLLVVGFELPSRAVGVET